MSIPRSHLQPTPEVDPRTARSSRLFFPLNREAILTDRYGAHRRYGAHTGADYRIRDGNATIHMPAHGRILFAGWWNGYGNVVVTGHQLRDGRNVVFMSAHHARNDVRTGDWVRAGQPIGVGGNTGGRYPLHAHFEIRELAAGRDVFNVSANTRAALNSLGPHQDPQQTAFFDRGTNVVTAMAQGVDGPDGPRPIQTAYAQTRHELGDRQIVAPAPGTRQPDRTNPYELS